MRGVTFTLPAPLCLRPEASLGATVRRHPAIVPLVRGGAACALPSTDLRPMAIIGVLRVFLHHIAGSHWSARRLMHLVLPHAEQTPTHGAVA
ncbi:MAG: hypothetical protein ACK4TB_03105 [Gemmobacter sp.]